MLITEQKDLDAFCTSLKGCEFITVDTEFLREKTYYPKLCVIQIGDPQGNAKAIDTLVEDLNLTPVFDLLFDESILKIFHAARQDLEIFFNLTGKVVHPFFDTQIAAMVCGYGDSVGYESLVRNITGEKLDKSVQYTNWSHRPLSKKQIDYALGDVTHLVKIYEQLSMELEKRGRVKWVYQEEAILEDPATYEVDAHSLWKKVKVKSPKPQTLAILREITAWRERRAKKKDMPRSWVLRDETLADMAAQAPRSPEALKKIRNYPAELVDHKLGRQLLEAIESVLNSDPTGWPEVKRNKPPSSRVLAIVEILKLLLKLQSAEHEVASKLIASSEDLEKIAKDDNADVPALKGWRREIFGEEALAMKHGRLSIGLKNDKVVKFKMSE